MQLTLGRVHWGWCVFPFHNKSPYPRLSKTNRFPSDRNTRWLLLIIIVVNFTAINQPHISPRVVVSPNQGVMTGREARTKITVATDTIQGAILKIWLSKMTLAIGLALRIQSEKLLHITVKNWSLLV